MKSEVSVNILDNSTLPALWQQFGIGPLLHQHDNAPVHKAKVIASWFEDNKVDVMNWRAQTSSIEHLQDVLKRRLRARSIQPKGKQEVFIMLQDEWKQIPPSEYQNLVKTVPLYLHIYGMGESGFNC